MLNEKMKDVLRYAVGIVLSRAGDVSMEDGEFATVDTHEIILLEEAIVEAFELDSDDVTRSDVSHIGETIKLL